MADSFTKIYEVVKCIPKGCVASYGQVAALAGNSRWARVVGYALHADRSQGELPCHRVVTKDGNVSGAFLSEGINRQIELLEAEGIEFVNGQINMDKFQWKKIRF